MHPQQFHHRYIEAASLVVLGTCILLAQPAAHAAPEPVLPAAEPVQQFALLDKLATTDPVLGAALPGATLEAQRGGTDTVSNNMQLDGSVRDNVAHNVVTGSNSIDAGSFANMAGIPTVIQNSGANVLIQNATIINLQFK